MSLIRETVDEARYRLGESRELRAAFRVGTILLVLLVVLSVVVVTRVQEPARPWFESAFGAVSASLQTQSDTDAGIAATQFDEEDDSTVATILLGSMVGVTVLAFLALVGTLLFGLVRMSRERGPTYDELPAEEQARRREAARLLRHINDP